jgi:hypothetical protein
MSLLRALDRDDWSRPTLAAAWRVRDVVAHLLDGDLRKLSGGRDGHAVSPRPVSSFAEVVELVNELNAGGVSYARRLSHAVLIDLLEVTGTWVAEFVAALPPHEEARWAVAWAGESRSENWMDIGREYTERWHHQMQIREAVGAGGLFERRWFYPILDLSVRAFRRAFEPVAADVGAAVVFDVETEGESVWSVVREASGWTVSRGRAASPVLEVHTDADTAWKMFYNALEPQAVRDRLRLDGDRTLAEPLIHARAIMV